METSPITYFIYRLPQKLQVFLKILRKIFKLIRVLVIAGSTGGLPVFPRIFFLQTKDISYKKEKYGVRSPGPAFTHT
jgi:hypothetical protein